MNLPNPAKNNIADESDFGSLGYLDMQRGKNNKKSNKRRIENNMQVKRKINFGHTTFRRISKVSSAAILMQRGVTYDAVSGVIPFDAVGVEEVFLFFGLTAAFSKPEACEFCICGSCFLFLE
jgi:hypothetical protein